MSLVWPRLKFFSELTRVQSSSTRLRLPVPVYLLSLRRMLVRQSPDNNIRVTHSLEYIFKLPFPVSGRGAFRSFQPLATPCRTLHSIQDIAFPRVVRAQVVSLLVFFQEIVVTRKNACVIFSGENL